MRRRRISLPENYIRIVEWEFDQNGLVVCKKIVLRRVDD